MPAKKPGQPSRRSTQAARRRSTPARPNHRPPRILDGYQRTRGTWTARSPAQVVLVALTTGATWEIAAKVAHLHERTPAIWDTRGAEIAETLPDDTAMLGPGEPDENHAYLAFHRAAQHAKVQIVHGALGALDHAQRQGNVQAAEIVLKRHPEAKAYRPAEAHELTGPEGGPIPIDVRAALRVSVEAMVERMAANRTPEALPPGDD